MAIIHKSPSKYCHCLVKIKKEYRKFFDDATEIIIEDWWDRVYGDSWKFADGNPGCLKYAMMLGMLGINPFTDKSEEVLYGHASNSLGYLIHENMIEEIK